MKVGAPAAGGVHFSAAAEFQRVGQKLIVEWSKRAAPDGEAIVKAMQ